MEASGAMLRVGSWRECDMQCTKPLTMAKLGIDVACGKCRACRIQRARHWAARMAHEMPYHKSNTFVTLTYDEEHLPKDGMLDKKVFTDWIKALRREMEPERIKYYGCGEYGDKYGRPHYHAALFGVPLEGHKLQRAFPRGFFARGGPTNCWENGIVHIDYLCYDACRYVADYIQKKMYGKKATGRVEPFALMSNGIGYQWLLDNAVNLMRNRSLTVRGKQVGIPRYYVKKLEEIWEPGTLRKYLENAAVEAEAEELEILEEKYGGDLFETLSERGLQRRQREKTLAAEENLYAKGVE